MAKLQAKSVYFTVPVYNDAGSGAKQDLATWKPELPQGFFYLGPSATNGSNDASGVIVKEIEPGALGTISDWVQIWNDTGSGKKIDYSLWTAVPEDPNYVALGGFFVRTHQKPTIDDTRGLRTIRKDLVTKVKPGREVWNDLGSKAHADGAVWNISTVGNLLALDAGTFIPAAGFNNPPAETWAIDRSKITPL